jgi:hypothetical protein
MRNEQKKIVAAQSNTVPDLIIEGDREEINLAKINRSIIATSIPPRIITAACPLPSKKITIAAATATPAAPRA